MAVPADNEEEARLFESLENRGEAIVRSLIDTGSFGAKAVLVRKWLYLKDYERAQARDAQSLRSIQIAEDAAKASKQSARWTMVAALVALASVLFPLADKHHWFGL